MAIPEILDILIMGYIGLGYDGHIGRHGIKDISEEFDDQVCLL
jgi:hypothetical protein